MGFVSRSWWLAVLCGVFAVLCTCGESDETSAPGGGPGGMAGSGGAGATGGVAGGAAGSGGSGAGVQARFPLSLTPGERFLREASGSPFFFHGDTAWSLMAQLPREEAEQYLEDRRQKGFTVVLVNLLEHWFADQAPSNAYGEPPFSTAGDYSTPNEAYFAHADWVLEQAEQRGLLVLLAPSYLGWGGGQEGFYQEMVANGATALEGYGRFLGQRYRDQPNILWLHACDYDPPDQDLVRAIAEAIRAEAPSHLHSAHTQRNETASSIWGQEPWLDVDNVYTSAETYGPTLALYQTATRPFFLVEAYYEGANDMTEQGLRAQAYGALLAGAMGQIFGANPMWCFGAESCLGSTGPPTTWQEQLDSRGSQDMAVIAQLFGGLDWTALAPDDTLMASNSAGAIAARAEDGSFGLLYTTSLGSVEIDLTAFSTPVRIQRIDPTSAAPTLLTSDPIDNQGTYAVTLDQTNETDTSDWLVLIAP